MERTIKRQKNLYKKLGGGILRLSGRIIKPGQQFEAHAEEIPKAFNDIITLVKDNEGERVKKASEKASEFTIKPRGSGWFNVVNASGKVMNEDALRENDANDLKKALEG